MAPFRSLLYPWLGSHKEYARNIRNLITNFVQGLDFYICQGTVTKSDCIITSSCVMRFTIICSKTFIDKQSVLSQRVQLYSCQGQVPN